MSLFHFFTGTRHVKSAWKACRSPITKQILLALPKIAELFHEAALSIYSKVLLGQFKDYEERYGSTLLATIDDHKKAALIQTITDYMLYAFFRQIESICPEQEIALPMTYALCADGGSRRGGGDQRSGEGFIGYLMYQNPNFEEPRMAVAFKFGEDVAQIMETADRPFSFMAAQQAMIISEITKRLIEDILASSSPEEDRGQARGDRVIAIKYFGWWFVWGIFSGIMICIVMKGGNMGFGRQLFVILGIGILSGSTALCHYMRRGKGPGRVESQ